MSDDKPTTPAPEPDATQALPASGETRELPAARPEDPLSIFDRPDPYTAAPVPGPASEPSSASSSEGTADGSFEGSPGPVSGAEPLSGSEPAPQPAAPAQAAAEPHDAGPRGSTIVWGFLVVAFGVGLLASAAGAHIDIELAAIVLLAAAGGLLVIGSVVSALRRRRRAAASA